MKWSLAIAVCCALVLSAFVSTRAAEEKTESKSDAKPAKIVQPWNKLTSLTDEQKSKIADIHKKANDEVNAIHKKEQADIMALLTDEQKAELKSMKEKDSGDKKVKKGADDASGAAQSPDTDKKADGDKKPDEAK